MLKFSGKGKADRGLLLLISLLYKDIISVGRPMRIYALSKGNYSLC